MERLEGLKQFAASFAHCVGAASRRELLGIPGKRASSRQDAAPTTRYPNQAAASVGSCQVPGNYQANLLRSPHDPARPSPVIRLLLAEDQAMVRGALSALLGLEDDIEVVGAVADGESAWRELQRLKPDILVTDIEMPGLTGLELAQRIHRHELATRVVIVTTFARPGFLRRALDAGVAGYLLKDAPADRLVEAVRQVSRGGRAVDPELAIEAWSEADPLNDRERQVLRLAGEGRSAGEIATQLHLSPGTVRNYLSEAIGKLGVGNRIEAARLARQKGWL